MARLNRIRRTERPAGVPAPFESAVPAGTAGTRWTRGRWTLLGMAAPSLVLLLLFAYLPLIGWLLAFYDYKPGYDFFNLKFAGLKYVILAFSDGEILRILRNTLVMSGLNLLFSPLPMVFAIFLTEIRFKWIKKLIQTTTTLPYFISWVLVFALAYVMFNINDGLFNKLVVALGLSDKALDILGNEDIVWYFQTGIGIWKGLGFSAIVYVAAITGIDPELVDAAAVDGAGRYRRILHVVLPGLLPTYFVLLLLGIGNLLNNGFEQYYLFYNGLVANKIEVLDYYVYRMGIFLGNYPISTAIGMTKTLVSILLLTIANQSARVLLDRKLF